MRKSFDVPDILVHTIELCFREFILLAEFSFRTCTLYVINFLQRPNIFCKAVIRSNLFVLNIIGVVLVAITFTIAFVIQLQ